MTMDSQNQHIQAEGWKDKIEFGEKQPSAGKRRGKKWEGEKISRASTSALNCLALSLLHTMETYSSSRQMPRAGLLLICNSKHPVRNKYLKRHLSNH